MNISLVIAAGLVFLGTVEDDSLSLPAAVEILNVPIPTPQGVQVSSQRVVRPFLGLLTIDRSPLPAGAVVLGPDSMSADEWRDLERQYDQHQADKRRARAERAGIVVPGIQPGELPAKILRQ